MNTGHDRVQFNYDERCCAFSYYGVDREDGVNIDKNLEDILLFAYVDGEASKSQRHFVEAVLARDPDAQQRIAESRN